MRRSAAITILGLALMGMPAIRAQRESSSSGPQTVGEQYLFEAANAERAQRGLPSLRWDASLHEAAMRHAHAMASRASISHQYPGEADLAERARQAGARFSFVAENVAEASTAVRIHDAWMNSTGHRENLLDQRATSVGISVLSRDGELYAVEDFSRSVVPQSIEQQETSVQAALDGVADLTFLPTTDAARQTGAMETGYVGSHKPWFVMRYTTANLAQLPEQLRAQLETGRYHAAQIAACPSTNSGEFTSFRLAVLLYPTP
jgi:hypothetical protein